MPKLRKKKDVLAAKEQGKNEDKEKAERRILAVRQTLSEMIATEPVLTDKLCEAIETGRFFITVTVMKKYKPDDKDDLHHTFIRKGINPNDCLLSIKTLKNDLIAKEMPNAEIDPDAGWH